MRLFPGTLVFSIAQTSDLVKGLRQLGSFESGRQDFDFGSVEVVVDLRGLTFWQRNPPQMYASLSWKAVDDLRLGRHVRPRTDRAETTIDIEARVGGETTAISLFRVDASVLPLPTRREVSWVLEQLSSLSRDRRQ
jgi:hypothetical protein